MSHATYNKLSIHHINLKLKAKQIIPSSFKFMYILVLLSNDNIDQNVTLLKHVAL